MNKMPNATEIAVKKAEITALYEALETVRDSKSIDDAVKAIKSIIESKK